MKIISLLLLTFFSYTIAAKTFQINTQHSFVNFEVDYMKVSVVKGTFDNFRGFFDYDIKKQKADNLKFYIKTTSINTRDKQRDRHLRSDEFFDAKNNTMITFESVEFLYKDEVPHIVIGNLSLNDKTKEVSFDIDWKGIKQDPFDKDKSSLFASVSAKINRKDFGLTWNKKLDSGGLLISDEVRISAIIEANPTDARPAFSRFFRSGTKPGKKKVLKNRRDNESD